VLGFEGLFELPGDQFLDGTVFDVFGDTLFREEIIEGRTDETILYNSIPPLWTSLRRFLARSSLSWGVFHAFLMKPCNRTMYSFHTMKKTLAMRPARVERTSHRFLVGGRKRLEPLSDRFVTKRRPIKHYMYIFLWLHGKNVPKKIRFDRRPYSPVCSDKVVQGLEDSLSF